ncbi:hypothetical protein [Terrimonas pollutisoli]|uniref:hypothetical protein n=1 Tax=Terrimonas pollutisoli TaxID=3034147 RepID=UPI0023EC4D22|nr:hypothetical protein [Terrimonas sp. H1YJ31]
MEKYVSYRTDDFESGNAALNDLADQLVQTFVVKANQRNICLVNEIPPHLQLKADIQMTASIVSGLLASLVSHAMDTCIRLSAKKYGNVILLQARDGGSLNSSLVEAQLQVLQPLAEKLKGSIAITSQRKNATTITFGFPNLPYRI